MRSDAVRLDGSNAGVGLVKRRSTICRPEHPTITAHIDNRGIGGGKPDDMMVDVGVGIPGAVSSPCCVGIPDVDKG